MKNIILLLVLTATTLLAQELKMELPTDDNTSGFTVTGTDTIRMMKFFADGGFFLSGEYGQGAIPVEGAGMRVMWYPGKAAFRNGECDGTQWNDTNIGNYSFSSGYNTIANGECSTAFGMSTTASGEYSTVAGENTIAGGISSTALGKNSSATGNYSIVSGRESIAEGISSSAMGYLSSASGNNSIALGYESVAGGLSSTAIGYLIDASGDYSTAVGMRLTASGNSSTAIGFESKAEGLAAVAMGTGNNATGNYSTAMGYGTSATGNVSTAFGWESAAESGYASTAIGYRSATGGKYSTAIGMSVKTGGLSSVAMGGYCRADAEGNFAIADGATTQSILINNSENSIMTRFASGYYLYTDRFCTIGAYLHEGDNSWRSISDSTKKENYVEANGEYFLNGISKLKLGSWNYKVHGKELRHYGPMAQEIFYYFGKDKYGTIGNDTTLASADMDGIMMIACKALEKRTSELKSRAEALQTENTELQSFNSELRSRREELTKRVSKLEKMFELFTQDKIAEHETANVKSEM